MPDQFVYLEKKQVQIGIETVEVIADGNDYAITPQITIL